MDTNRFWTWSLSRMKVIPTSPPSREGRCTTIPLPARPYAVNSRRSSGREGARVCAPSEGTGWARAALPRSCGEAAPQKPAQENNCSFSNDHPREVSKEDSEGNTSKCFPGHPSARCRFLTAGCELQAQPPSTGRAHVRPLSCICSGA